MRSEWEEVRLGNITTKIGSGATPRGGSQVYSDAGVTFIRSQNVLNCDFNIDGLVFINDEHAKQLENVAVHENDILLNITGDSVARACLAPTDMLPARVNQHVSIIRVNPSIADHKYILYQLQNLKDLLLSYSHSGATRKALTKSMLENLKITLPTLPEQKAISDILACLDAKIELNNKINENLEAQAQAIFKSWFVDFEPFQDGEFVESELGLIPEGWEVCRLEDFMFFQEGPGIRHWQFVEKDGTPFINIRCIQGQDLDLKTANMVSREEANGRYSHFLVKEWDILMSTSGTLGRYAIVRKDHLPLCMNTSVIRFFPKHDFEHYSYTYGYITSWEFSTHLVEKGSGSVQLNFGPTHLKQISLVKPSEEVLRSYHELVFPMIKKTVQLRHQNSMLAALRDTLLPKLMSGEIEVPVD